MRITLLEYKQKEMNNKDKQVCSNSRCGKTFIGRKRKFCSYKCQQNLKFPDKLWKKETRICFNVDCKKEFKPVVTNQKLCSKECVIIVRSFEYNARNGAPNGYYKLRFEVFKRDNFTCQYCGRNVKEDKIKIHCDHIKPKKEGGETIPKNLITSCLECNEGKKDVLLKNSSI